MVQLTAGVLWQADSVRIRIISWPHPVAKRNLYGPLVIALMGFHCNTVFRVTAAFAAHNLHITRGVTKTNQRFTDLQQKRNKRLNL